MFMSLYVQSVNLLLLCYYAINSPKPPYRDSPFIRLFRRIQYFIPIPIMVLPVSIMAHIYPLWYCNINPSLFEKCFLQVSLEYYSSDVSVILAKYLNIINGHTK